MEINGAEQSPLYGPSTLHKVVHNYYTVIQGANNVGCGEKYRGQRVSLPDAF